MLFEPGKRLSDDLGREPGTIGADDHCSLRTVAKGLVKSTSQPTPQITLGLWLDVQAITQPMLDLGRRAAIELKLQPDVLAGLHGFSATKRTKRQPPLQPRRRLGTELGDQPRFNLARNRVTGK